MKRLIGSLTLVMLCVSAVHAGPNAGAKFVATLDRTSGVKAGDTVTLTIAATGLNTCTGFTAEAIYNDAAFGDPATASAQPFLSPGAQTAAFTTLAGYNRRTFMGAAQLGGSTTAAGSTNLATFAFTAKAGFTAASIAIRQLILNSNTLRDTIPASPSPLVLQINGGGFIEAIPGDINKDGVVDFEDFFILAANFGKQGPKPTEGARTVIQTVTVRDTVIVTRMVRDTVFVFAGGVKRDTVYVLSDEQNRPPIKSSWDEVVKSVRPAVYWLGVTTWNSNDPIYFIGTGFAVLSDALATNYHVSIGAQDVAKKFFPNTRAAYVAIKVDGQPTETDMYYLNMDDKGGVLGFWHPEYDGTVSSPDVMLVTLHKDEKKRFASYVRLIGFRDAKELNVGDEIGTLGFPGDLEVSQARSTIRAIPTFKQGTTSALRPYKTSFSSANPMGRVSNRILQHDFNVTPGTSGSPIFNRRGEIVAINNAVSKTEASLGFGIRADEIRQILQALAVNAGTVIVNSTKPAIPQELLPKETGGK